MANIVTAENKNAVYIEIVLELSKDVVSSFTISTKHESHTFVFEKEWNSCDEYFWKEENGHKILDSKHWSEIQNMKIYNMLLKHIRSLIQPGTSVTGLREKVE